MCKDDTVELLSIPYDDFYFNVVLSSRETGGATNFPWWVDTIDSGSKFTPRIGADRSGGPTIYADYVTRGYVSQEVINNVLAGKEWNPVSGSWN